MRTLLKNIKGLVGAFEEVPRDVAGSEMAKFPILHNAWLALEDGVVVDFGGMDDFPGIVDWSGLNIVDAEGRWVLPAWCDSHTHTVFARSRSEEFLMRLEGATYQEVAERGGGILNSAKALQAMGEDELFEDALKRVHRAISQGVGAMEIKSGYGLTLDAERKMLRVIARLKEAAPIPIKATFLGCHAVPPEFEDAAAYTQHVVTDMLPALAEEGLIDYVDAFCEKGYFGVDETRALLDAAHALGLKSKVHVNQFNDIGGVELCVNQNALSVDHLEVCESEAIQSLIEGFERAEDGEGSPTYPVALPGCSHFLSIPYAPGRAIIDAGLPLVLATDHNPGSAPSGDMTQAVRLASLKMGVLPREAVAAATLNGAAAMELSHEVGALGRGHRANLILTHPMEGLQDIAYRFTDAVVDKVFINGEIWEG
jgi:imidazolonepropionase